MGRGVVNVRLLVLLLSIGLASGCTKMTRIEPDAGRLAYRIQPGDTVHVLTKDGRRLEFEVVSIDDELISGSETSVRVEAIQELRREDPKYRNPVQTLVVVLAMIGGVVLLLAL